MDMRDIYQVLYRKERELERVRREVEVLKFVLPLLQDEAEQALIVSAAAGVPVIPFERASRSAPQRFPSPLSR